MCPVYEIPTVCFAATRQSGTGPTAAWTVRYWYPALGHNQPVHAIHRLVDVSGLTEHTKPH